MIRIFYFLSGLAAWAALVSGCTLTRPVEDRTSFYLLKTARSEADGEIGAEAGEAGALEIGLRRVRLEDYFNSPAMVVRTGENSLRYADYHRWAEGLDRGASRLLQEVLRQEPSVSFVHLLPEAGRETVDYEIEVRLLACEAIEMEEQRGRYAFEAVWNVYEGRERKRVAGDRFIREGPWRRGDYAAFAHSVSSACAELGREIAAELGAREKSR